MCSTDRADDPSPVLAPKGPNSPWFSLCIQRHSAGAELGRALYRYNRDKARLVVFLLAKKKSFPSYALAATSPGSLDTSSCFCGLGGHTLFCHTLASDASDKQQEPLLTCHRDLVSGCLYPVQDYPSHRQRKLDSIFIIRVPGSWAARLEVEAR
jgi:hypothetical protein